MLGSGCLVGCQQASLFSTAQVLLTSAVPVHSLACRKEYFLSLLGFLKKYIVSSYTSSPVSRLYQLLHLLRYNFLVFASNFKYFSSLFFISLVWVIEWFWSQLSATTLAFLLALPPSVCLSGRITIVVTWELAEAVPSSGLFCSYHSKLHLSFPSCRGFPGFCEESVNYSDT